jgi:hypothetical protein
MKEETFEDFRCPICNAQVIVEVFYPPRMAFRIIDNKFVRYDNSINEDPVILVHCRNEHLFTRTNEYNEWRDKVREYFRNKYRRID